jgi:hypothetical protein
VRKTQIPMALALSASLALLATGASAQSVGQPADIVENFATMASGGPDLLLAENAVIERSPDGVTISLELLTPEPGTYTYPEDVPADRQAAPESFTGWAFVFNHPEFCKTSAEPPFCGSDDFNDQVKFGIYNFGGFSAGLSQHAGSDAMQNESTDGMVMLSGTINAGDAQRVNMPPDVVTFALENPEGAEIHAAIAPHGQLDVTKLPDDLYNPMGDPGCECWWVGIFMPPAQ